MTPGFSSTARPKEVLGRMMLVALAILGAVAVVGLGAVLVWARFLLDELGQPGPG
jgi:hypothetical protein